MIVVRDRLVVGLRLLCGRSTAGHDNFEFVVEVLRGCVVGRRVGVGIVEGLFPGVLGKCVSCVRPI